MAPHKNKLQGFTLIEISIVLVIIGLVVGGILVGREMVRAAEVRAIISEIDKMKSGIYTFKAKYGAFPGDMVNATEFWGADVACPNTPSNSVVKTATCNGNGDGIISDYWLNPQFYESYRMWQQLSNAGMFAGNFTGVEGPSGPFHALINVNVPGSRVPNAGYWFVGLYDLGTIIDPSCFYPIPGPHVVWYGTQFENDATEMPVLSPAEAFSIDTKIDDGSPGKGNVTVFKPGCYDPVNVECATIDDPDTAAYKTTYHGIACSLLLNFKL